MITAAHELETVYPESFRQKKLARGALATVRAGQLIEDQLARTIAAENARKLRAIKSRRYIQKRGVIAGGKCRKMIEGRKDEEDRLELDREMKAIRQRRDRWGVIFRELVNKTPYYIGGHSCGLSSI